MYCVIFRLAGLTCLLQLLQPRDDHDSSWKMIDAVMYGMIPSAKTESCSSAPPLNRLTSP